MYHFLESGVVGLSVERVGSPTAVVRRVGEFLAHGEPHILHPDPEL